MKVGVPMTVLRISCCRASDTDLRGDFVNACSVERAGGPQYWGRGGNAERLLIYLLLRHDNTQNLGPVGCITNRFLIS